MDGIKTVFTFCILFGTVFLSIILVVSRILLWIAPDKSRNKRLNVIAWAAAGILSIMFFAHYGGNNLNQIENDTKWPEIFLSISHIMIGLMIFGTIAFSAIALLLVIILFVRNGLLSILQGLKGTKKGKKEKEEEERAAVERANRLFEIVKSQGVILIIAWGVVALFLVLPFLAGTQTDGDMLDLWEDGVYRIAAPFTSANTTETTNDTDTKEVTDDTDTKEAIDDTDTNDQFSSEHLIIYILAYVIVIGVGYAIIRILYSIISETIHKKHGATILDEYSSSIGFLAVGISILCSFQKKAGNSFKLGEKISDFGKSFIIVVVVVAFAILTLEIIRLLMDMREKIIRKEARFLFISLIGQVSLLLSAIVNMVCGSLNSAVGTSINYDMDQIQRKLTWKIMKEVDKQLDKENDDQEQERTFAAFKEQVTKK